MRSKYRGLAFGVAFYLLAVTSYCVFNYLMTKAKLLAEVDQRLMAGARAALLIAPEELSIPDPKKVMGESAYMDLLERMNAYVKDAGIDFIYTMAQDDEGKIYFSASSFIEEDREKNMLTPYEYEDHSLELEQQCFRDGKIIFEDFTDSEGFYRSAFIPAKNKEGKIYVAAGDIEISYVESLLRRDILRSVAQGLVFGLFILPFLYSVYRMTRTDQAFLRQQIDERTQEIQVLNKELERRVEQAERAAHQATRYGQEAERAKEEAEKARASGMAEAASVLSEIVEKSMCINDDLKRDVSGVIGGSEVQKLRIQETADAMDELNQTAAAIAENAASTAATAEEARRTAESGEAAVADMAGAIQDLQKSAEETSKGLRELGSHADGIGRVMGLISDIADQTNLLSLNASIEAARAGDAGRGFTVVAGEVRKLAEKTMQATRAVTEAVTQIQKETRSSVSTMGETARAVDESMVLARKAGDALTNIRLIVGRNSSLAANIASASKQQSTTFDHIVRTNEEVNSIVNSSLDQMERASGSMEELSEQIQQINTLIGELRQKQ